MDAMGDSIRIRHAEPPDYQPVIAVLDDWWGGRKMTDMLPRLFFVHFRPTSFVAEHRGQIVGFLIGFVSQTFPNEAYIHFAGIHPEFRKRGLGAVLYERFFDTVKKLGCNVVRCLTGPANEGSIAFHRRMGFNLEPGSQSIGGIPVTADYDGLHQDRVLFCRKLTAQSP